MSRRNDCIGNKHTCGGGNEERATANAFNDTEAHDGNGRGYKTLVI
jgi:hypothetical protein